MIVKLSKSNNPEKKLKAIVGNKTAGFWSKNILWNKPTLKASIRNAEKKFNIKIKNN
jgi:hypothetical protein